MLAFHKLGYRHEWYDAVKKGAQYLLDCQKPENKGGIDDGLLGGGKDPFGQYLGWRWTHDNAFAYLALMAAQRWANVEGDSLAGAAFSGGAGRVLAGINRYLHDPGSGVWQIAVDQSGTPLKNPHLPCLDASAPTYPSWIQYAPQMLDLPVAGATPSRIGDWIRSNFGDQGAIGYTCDDGLRTRKYPGFAFQACLVWLDSGQADYCAAALDWAEKSGLYQDSPDQNGVTGGWVDWIESAPEQGKRADWWLRFIDTSFYVTTAWSGGYDFFDALPAPVGVSPPAGSASDQTMTITFTDSFGYQDLGVVNILVNNFLDGRRACYLAYSQPSNVLYLVDDAGGTLLPGSVLTSSGTISNSQCTVSWSSSAVAANGNTLMLTLTFGFTASFAGSKVIYLAAGDVAGTNSGWQPMGVWQVPGGVPATTTAVVGMNPASGSGLGPAAFAFSFSDTMGFQDLGVVNILVNDFLDGRHACYLAYARSYNVLYLMNDNGDALLAGQPLSSGGTTSNSQCTVSWSNTPASGNGNSLTLALSIGFNSGFVGNRVFYLAARDVNEANNTGWQAMGSWTMR